MKSTLLLKLGGRAFESSDGYASLARSIKKLSNHSLIIVHGGGADISQALRDAHRQPQFIDGYRVTSKEDMAIVERVLSTEVNQRIVDQLQQNGLACRGLSGRTQGLLRVRPMLRNGQSLGYVGEIESVFPEPLVTLLDEDVIPVVSPISADENGNSYNVNADSAAAALAVGMGSSDLIYFTDVPGVRAGDRLVSSLTIGEAQNLIATGQIRDGMIAKMESVFRALDGGVSRVHITCWQDDQTLVNTLNHKTTHGTLLYKQ
ncbi:MAG TPA: acetylglutamate kinase [bacterium]|nr:acetylglutamate kinase [bacterium]